MAGIFVRLCARPDSGWDAASNTDTSEESYTCTLHSTPQGEQFILVPARNVLNALPGRSEGARINGGVFVCVRCLTTGHAVFSEKAQVRQVVW